jgi:hypothetical protein
VDDADAEELFAPRLRRLRQGPALHEHEQGKAAHEIQQQRAGRKRIRMAFCQYPVPNRIGTQIAARIRPSRKMAVRRELRVASSVPPCDATSATVVCGAWYGLLSIASPSRLGPADAGRQVECAGVQVRGNVTPVWPWYLPPRSRYEVRTLVGLEEQHLRHALVRVDARRQRVVLLNSSVTCPSHSGSSGVTLTMIPQRAYVLLPRHTTSVSAECGSTRPCAPARRNSADDANVGFDVDEAPESKCFGSDDRRVDVGEHLELARARTS